MDDFGPGLATGLGAGIFILFIIGMLAMPAWHDRVAKAKEQGCAALGAKFEADGTGEHAYANGQCVKGNTIVLRFKD